MDSENRYQKIYCELRQEGERTISGVALRYGDICELPWGEKEKFSRGAFGDVENADVILNWQHNRGAPLARTGGGGLKIFNSSSELRLEATIPDTTQGNDVMTMVRNKVLRGLSIEFSPERSKIVREGDTTTINSAILRGVAIVDRPGYPQSVIDQRRAEMDKKELHEMAQKAVDSALAKAREENTSIVTYRMEQEQINEIVDAVTDLVKRDTDDGDVETTEEGNEDDVVRSEEDIVAEANRKAEQRAEYYTKFRVLLPEEYELEGKSTEDILREAVGDEVEDKEERSDDYLLAYAENVLNRRESAYQSRVPDLSKESGNRPFSGITSHVMKRMRKDRESKGGK